MILSPRLVRWACEWIGYALVAVLIAAFFFVAMEYMTAWMDRDDQAGRDDDDPFDPFDDG